MAPSPTGKLHLGTAYTTLFNYLFAKGNNGVFILRLEDTDIERSKKEFEDDILEGLSWLGLSWDEGPYRQSERLDNYRKAAKKLVGEGQAYYCFCSEEELKKVREDQRLLGIPQVYSGKCRNLTPQEIENYKNAGKEGALRFKMPDDRGEIVFNDLIHGQVRCDSKLIGDTVIMRANNTPLYNFAVVVDDIDMGITHVLRGEDHLSNTPKQIVLFEALGAALPQIAHWPNILNPDRIGKLSKREGATAVSDYRKEGYLAEAVVNYLALLGWTMPEDKEIMTLAEMEQTFDIQKMRISPKAFDQAKLDWTNGEYIRKLSDAQLTVLLQDYLVDHPAKDKIDKATPLIKERIKKLSEFIPLTNFLWQKPEYDRSVFETLQAGKDIQKTLDKIVDRLQAFAKPWSSEQFEQTFRELADEEGIPAKDMFQLIRAAVSGQLITPPLFESIQILGEDETLRRVEYVARSYQDLPKLTEQIASEEKE